MIARKGWVAMCRVPASCLVLVSAALYLVAVTPSAFGDDATITAEFGPVLGRDLPQVKDGPPLPDRTALLDFCGQSSDMERRLQLVASALEIEDSGTIRLWPVVDFVLEEVAWQARLSGYAEQIEKAIAIKDGEKRKAAIIALGQRVTAELAAILPSPPKDTSASKTTGGNGATATVEPPDLITPGVQLGRVRGDIAGKRALIALPPPDATGKDTSIRDLGEKLVELAEREPGALRSALGPTIEALRAKGLSYEVRFSSSDAPVVALSNASREAIQSTASTILTGVEGYLEPPDRSGPTTPIFVLGQPFAHAQSGADGRFGLPVPCRFSLSRALKVSTASLGGLSWDGATVTICGEVRTKEWAGVDGAQITVYSPKAQIPTDKGNFTVDLSGTLEVKDADGNTAPAANHIVALSLVDASGALLSGYSQWVQTDDDGKFTLTLDGKVETEPAEGALDDEYVWLVSDSGTEREVYQVTRDASGYFACFGLPAGKYGIAIAKEAPDGMPALSVALREGVLSRVRQPDFTAAGSGRSGDVLDDLTTSTGMAKLSGFAASSAATGALLSTAVAQGGIRLGVAGGGGHGTELAYFLRYPLHKNSREHATRTYPAGADISVNFVEAKTGEACPEGEQRSYIKALVDIKPDPDAVDFKLRQQMHHPLAVGLGYSTAGEGDAYMLGLAYSPVREVDVMAGWGGWSKTVAADGVATTQTATATKTEWDDDWFWGISLNLTSLLFD